MRSFDHSSTVCYWPGDQVKSGVPSRPVFMALAILLSRGQAVLEISSDYQLCHDLKREEQPSDSKGAHEQLLKAPKASPPHAIR